MKYAFHFLHFLKANYELFFILTFFLLLACIAKSLITLESFMYTSTFDVWTIFYPHLLLVVGMYSQKFDYFREFYVHFHIWCLDWNSWLLKYSYIDDIIS
jgi:hypothetical protein